MSLLTSKSLWKKALPSEPVVEQHGPALVKSALGAGAGLLVLSALSAAASAARRRQE